MDVAQNDEERKIIGELLEKGVAEALIRAFSWSNFQRSYHILIAIAEDHLQGKVAQVDMTHTQSEHQIEKTMKSLQHSRYECSIEEKMFWHTRCMASYITEELHKILHIHPPK